MRLSLIIVMLFCVITTKSQTSLFPDNRGYFPGKESADHIYAHDSIAPHKWFFTTYAGMYSGISFYRGGNASIFAAPLTLQLNRRLTNNFYGFANLSVAPAYISMNQSFITPVSGKMFPYNAPAFNRFGAYSSASLGLMYVNDARTFSISGSISAERSSNPLVPYGPLNNNRQNNITPANR